MHITNVLEDMRGILVGKNGKKMGKLEFYNTIFGTGLMNDNVFQIDLKNYEITRFSYSHSPIIIRQRAEIIGEGKHFDMLAAHYQNNLPITRSKQIEYMKALSAIFNTIKDKTNAANFYNYLAQVVIYCVIHEKELNAGNQYPFIPNDETIYDQMMRIFNDVEINHIVIVTQVGMILVTNDDVREAVKEYLKKEKSLEVIINTSETRETVGAHMKNSDMSHQTNTESVCKLWEKLKKDVEKEVGNVKLFVATTELPILHQTIKTSTVSDNSETNINVDIRMYTYLVKNKDDNISFTLTSASNKYDIIVEELDYLCRTASKAFITPNP